MFAQRLPVKPAFGFGLNGPYEPPKLFRKRDDLPVYHPDVRVYEVVDCDGSPLALFYTDFYARPSKTGGA